MLWWDRLISVSLRVGPACCRDSTTGHELPSAVAMMEECSVRLSSLWRPAILLLASGCQANSPAVRQTVSNTSVSNSTSVYASLPLPSVVIPHQAKRWTVDSLRQRDSTEATAHATTRSYLARRNAEPARQDITVRVAFKVVQRISSLRVISRYFVLCKLRITMQYYVLLRAGALPWRWSNLALFCESPRSSRRLESTRLLLA